MAGLALYWLCRATDRTTRSAVGALTHLGVIQSSWRRAKSRRLSMSFGTHVAPERGIPSSGKSREASAEIGSLKVVRAPWRLVFPREPTQNVSVHSTTVVSAGHGTGA